MVAEAISDSDAKFGRRIQELRERLEMSQSALADILDVKPAAIWKMEKGQVRLPRPERLREIAGALGTTPADLLTAAGYLDAGPVDWESMRLAKRIQDLPGPLRDGLEKMVNTAKQQDWTYPGRDSNP